MQTSQIILRNSVSGVNLGKLLSVGGGRAMPWLPHCFKCQRDLHRFQSPATQLFRFPPLGFLSCTVLIVPSPVLFYYNHPRSSLLCFEDQVQNKASQHSETGTQDLCQVWKCETAHSSVARPGEQPGALLCGPGVFAEQDLVLVS